MTGMQFIARVGMLHFYAALLALAQCLAGELADTPKPLYPPSGIVQELVWHWDSRVTAAPGSDLWPVTWGSDDHLYAAWGDGGGFGGTDSDGRVAMGIARIEGPPTAFRGFNVNGGMNPEHSATFPKKGKTAALACVDGVLYATINLQDGVWPDVNHVLMWSTDFGATWAKADWLFPKSAGRFRPVKFLNFGKDYTGVPAALEGYVYLYGARQQPGRGETELYLARIKKSKLREREAYEFVQRASPEGAPEWTADFSQAQPVFTDARGACCGGAVYNPGIKRYLMTAFHVGPGQLGIFDAPNPWGPWSTVMYKEDWGNMGSAGEGLTCDFPRKWMSADGLTLWSVFSVYGGSAKEGIVAHDRFNLVQTTLKLKQ